MLIPEMTASLPGRSGSAFLLMVLLVGDHLTTPGFLTGFFLLETRQAAMLYLQHFYRVLNQSTALIYYYFYLFCTETVQCSIVHCDLYSDPIVVCFIVEGIKFPEPFYTTVTNKGPVFAGKRQRLLRSVSLSFNI